MTHPEFQAYVNLCKSRGMTEYQIAKILGCSRNSVTKWKRVDPPPYIGLAIAALERNLKPWSLDS